MAKVKEQAKADAPIWREQSEAVSRAIQPLDLVAAEVEGRWGYGRLARLVAPEMAMKFGSAQDRLNAAIAANDGEEVAKRAAILIRGWRALAEAAEAAGHAPLPEGTWSVQHEGRAFTIVLDRADADAVARNDRSPETVVCLHELLAAWSAMRGRETIEAIKTKFPGATVQRLDEKRGDDLPF
jgi:hypothetical protein